MLDRRLLLLLAILTLTQAVASADEGYDVNGYDDAGNGYYGEVNVDDSGRGTGTVYDEEGNETQVNVDMNTDAERMDGNDGDANHYYLETDY